MEPKKDRVHKIIAQAGLMSRRKAEEAILAGRVFLNGEVLKELGTLADPAVDSITLDGNLVQLKSELKTYLFYKPRGVITSKGDPQGRPTVMDYFKEDQSLNPVGRLDFESEGLLLLTHDGELALKLTHPRYEVKKIYEVDVEGDITEDFLNAVTEKVELEDGPGKFDELREIDAAPAAKIDSLFVAPVRPKAFRTFVVTVSEGRNRFIRRMFEHFHLHVTRLKRIQHGPYQIGDLKPGEKREASV